MYKIIRNILIGFMIVIAGCSGGSSGEEDSINSNWMRELPDYGSVDISEEDISTPDTVIYTEGKSDEEV